MRSYAVSKNISFKKVYDYDVIIIGSGIAGLYCACHLDERKSVAIFNKLGLEESNSMYAQGGIAAVLQEADNFESHFNDTMAAGANICDKDAVKLVIEEGPDDIRNLIKLGVPFDRDKNKNISFTTEGAHSYNRIAHCGGDATGYHITKTLIDSINQKKNVTLYNYQTLTDVITDDKGEVNGAITQNYKGEYFLYKTQNIVIASGGIGRVYRNSTNSSSSTGDGIAAAMRAGAEVENMEFVQFHPTALIHPDRNMRFFLISEALRGEGALLLNRKGERFIKHHNPLAELASRDIVSRAIVHEMKKNDLPNVYLNITFKSREFLQKRFPKNYEACMERGIDIAVNWIPVLPVQHYFMGGLKTNLKGETNVSGLFACGESASSGVHGANRLASNSLLECLVFGRKCAETINLSKREGNVNEISLDLPEKNNISHDYQTYASEIRNTMTKKGGIIRKEKELIEAIQEIESYYNNLKDTTMISIKELEVLNMSTIALSILKAALDRKESIGAHYRVD